MEHFKNKLMINNNWETIKKIQQGMSICRYGDGEFTIILGGRTRLQPADNDLVNRLKLILKDNSQNILIGIPEAFNENYEKYTEKASNFWKNYNEKNLEKIISLLEPNKEYFSSQITWFYTDVKNREDCKKYVDELKKIWENKNLLIVEGEQTRMGLGNDLFKFAKSIKRILCPSENAYNSYNEILNTCMEFSRDYLVLIALGATATILAYDLANNGYQALDFGHVDLEYEWYLKNADNKIKIVNKFNKEINDYENIVGNIDSSYEKSIVKRIKKGGTTVC